MRSELIFQGTGRVAWRRGTDVIEGNGEVVRR